MYETSQPEKKANYPGKTIRWARDFKGCFPYGTRFHRDGVASAQ